MKRPTYFIVAMLTWSMTASFTSCSSSDDNGNEDSITITEGEITDDTEDGFALVTAVSTSGNEGNYTFSVTISSPDTGCDQYADWWEVLDADGTLLYRRILAHSHVNEQPFTRSGGTVPIEENTEVYIRAHMNTTGYGTAVMKGSVANGFQTMDLDSGFASDAATQAPLPDGCAF